jgi:Mor family transcriptional regulator
MEKIKTKPRYNEKVERNNEVYQDRLNGLSWSALSFKYQITIKTLFSIVKRLEAQKELQSQTTSSHEEALDTYPNQQ